MIEIDLQTGFDGQKVDLAFDTERVFSSESLTTKKLLGLAESIKIKDKSAGGRIIVLEVEGFPKYEIEIPATKEEFLHVGFYIEDKKIKHLVSDKPFGYG